MTFDNYYEDPTARGEVPEWTQLRSTTHTASIPHTCGACGQPITPGSRYHALVGVYDGKLVTAKTHFESCPGWESDWDEEHGAGGTYWWERIQ